MLLLVLDSIAINMMQGKFAESSKIAISALLLANVFTINTWYQSLLEIGIQVYSIPFNLNIFSQALGMIVLLLSAIALLHVSMCPAVPDIVYYPRAYWDHIKSGRLPLYAKEIIVFAIYSIVIISFKWHFLLSSLIGLAIFASLNVLMKYILDLSGHKTFVYTTFLFLAYNITGEKCFQACLAIDNISVLPLITLMSILFIMLFAALFTQANPTRSESWFIIMKRFLCSESIYDRTIAMFSSIQFWLLLVIFVCIAFIGWAVRHWTKYIFIYYSLGTTGFNGVFIFISITTLIRLLFRLATGKVTDWTPSGLLGRIGYISVMSFGLGSVINWGIDDIGTILAKYGEPMHMAPSSSSVPILPTPSSSSLPVFSPKPGHYLAIGESDDRLLDVNGEKVSLIAKIPDQLLLPVTHDGVISGNYLASHFSSGELGMVNKAIFKQLFQEYCLMTCGKRMSDELHLDALINPDKVEARAWDVQDMQRKPSEITPLKRLWFRYLNQFFDPKDGYTWDEAVRIDARSSRIWLYTIKHGENVHSLVHMTPSENGSTFFDMMNNFTRGTKFTSSNTAVFTLFIKGDTIIPFIHQKDWAQSLGLVQRRHIADFLAVYVSDRAIRIAPQYNVDFPSIKAYKLPDEAESLYPVLSWYSCNSYCPVVDNSQELADSAVDVEVDANGKQKDLASPTDRVRIPIDRLSAISSWNTNKAHPYPVGEVRQNTTELGIGIARKFITKEGKISAQVFNQTLMANILAPQQ